MLDPSDVLGDAGLRNFRWQTTYGSDFCSDFKEPPTFQSLPAVQEPALTQTSYGTCYHGCPHFCICTVVVLHLQSELDSCNILLESNVLV